MPVFKMLWKIINAKRNILFVYSTVFLVIFLVFTAIYKDQDMQNVDFDNTKTVIGINDFDQSDVSKQFVTYLKDYASVEDIDLSSEENIKDALFYTKIAYYVEIPKDFGKAFTSDTPISLITQSSPDSVYTTLTERLIENYLYNLNIYMEANPSRSLADVDTQIRLSQDKQVDVHFMNGETSGGEIVGLGMYFNYLYYIFSACFIMVGGTILLRVYDQEIRKRNSMSPISQISFNLQLGLGCISFAVAYWCVFMIFVQCILGQLFTQEGIFFMINSFIMVFVSMGLTFLIANLFSGKRNSDEALNACSNVISLGSSFLCGVFIPQFLLGETVKIFSSFLPAFWYIKANEMITATSLNGLDSGELLKVFGIQTLFGIVFFLLAFWISKAKASTKEFA